METFALFIWPGAILGGLIAYGYFVSRKPKTAAERAVQEERALEEAKKARQETEALIQRIAEIEAHLNEIDAQQKVEAKPARYATYYAGAFTIRGRNPNRAVVARYMQVT